MKQCRWCGVGSPKCTVRVTSVVPSTYWAPESCTPIREGRGGEGGVIKHNLPGIRYCSYVACCKTTAADKKVNSTQRKEDRRIACSDLHRIHLPGGEPAIQGQHIQLHQNRENTASSLKSSNCIARTRLCLIELTSFLDPATLGFRHRKRVLLLPGSYEYGFHPGRHGSRKSRTTGFKWSTSGLLCNFL